MLKRTLFKCMWLFLAIGWPQLAFSQYWIRNFGSLLNDEGTDISIDAAGNTYTTGYFSGSISFGIVSLASNGLTDMFIVKTDPAGVVVWAIKGGGPGSDRGLAIKADPQGNTYVTGFYTGSASFGSSNITSTGGSQDVFVAKYNNAGVLQWVRSGGGPLADVGYAVNVDLNGNVIVTGEFKGASSFGSFSQTSMNNPTTAAPTGDIFVVKYNASGTEQWFKAGKAKFEDWGTDVVADSNGDIYVTGRFSDTITFDNTHNNQMLNAAFLIKYNAAGNEQWFRRMGGTQTSAYALACDNTNQVYLAGDFLGSLTFFNGTAIAGTLTNPYTNKIFLVKYDASGSITWSKADGSDSEVSCRNLALDNSGNPYLTGFFKCKMNDYADLYGQGTFNSVGYRDLFVTKYNPQGTRQWARNCGGQKDDNPGGIAVNATGDVFIAGSFETRILFTATPVNPINSSYNLFGIINTATGGGYCSDPNYPVFKGVNSVGAMDILVAKNINFNREPYDYYLRSGGGCNRPYVKTCINNNALDNVCGPDTVQQCGTPFLNAATNTSFTGPFNYSGQVSAGPDFNYLWSTGATTKNISASTTGLYTVTITSVDGCFTSSDSIYVIINPAPPLPTVTDSKGINTNTTVAQPIELCDPDSVTLWGGNYGANPHSWAGPAGTYTVVNNETIHVFQSGVFTFTVTDANGCSSSIPVMVTIDGALDPIDPEIYVYSPTMVNDTVYLCLGQPFSVLVYDSITNPQGLLLSSPIDFSCPYSQWSVTPSCSYYAASPNCNLAYFYPNQSATYTVTYTIIRKNVCDTDTVVISIPVPVVLYPQPTVPPITITGPTVLCSGDTLTLQANGSSNYTWFGTGIIGPTNTPTVLVNQTGTYSVSVSATNQYGCTAYSSASINITTPTTPSVTMNPSNGIICPGGSITLTAMPNGAAYQWYGPSGLMPNTTQSIVVSSGGFYYCVVTIGGCVMVSNTVEVKEYATPILSAQPTTVICPGDSVVVQVMAVLTTNIQWAPPLSGSSLTQTIYTPGTYICSITSCNITTTDTIVITQGNPQAIIQPPGTHVICDLDTLVISANAGQAAYQWFPNGETTQSIGVTDPGDYYVLITDPFGCQDISDTVHVQVMPPVPPPTATNVTLCAGTGTTLTASGSGTLQWFTTASGGSPVATGNTYTTPVIQNPVTYYVQNMDSLLCPSNRIPVTISIFASSLPPVIYCNDTLFCEGDTIALSCNQLPGGNYTWTGPNGFNSTQVQPTPFPAAPASQGIYTLIVSDANCTSPVTDTLLTVVPTPAAPGLTIACNSICVGKPIEIVAFSVSSGQFTWYTPADTVLMASPYVINEATLENGGTYAVATQVGKCKSDFTFIDIDVDQCELVVPNVFSPNKKQENNVFAVMQNGLSMMHCIIFDRWGVKMAEWNDTAGSWDGNYNGKPAAEGVYYVLLEYAYCSDETVQTYKGFVHLFR